MPEAPGGAPSGAPVLSVVEITPALAGRPRVRVTTSMPRGMTPESAVKAARRRARHDPAHRFQVLCFRDASCEPLVLWDSQPPS